MWRGVRTKRGYGNVRILDRAYGAHRVAFQIFYGPIPEGKEVCHRCDTPACVNPFHLFAATHKENIHDAIRKGRMKFTPRALSAVQEAVVLSAPPGETRKLAINFGVSRKTIVRVRQRARRRAAAA